MRTKTIAIDVRMINQSGIGVYIQNIVRNIILGNQDKNFLLLGRIEELFNLPFAQQNNVKVIEFRSRVYSISEQFWWIFHSITADVLWIPHYNVPIFWRGRLFVTIHDVAHLALPEFRTKFIKRLYANTLIHYVQYRANGIAFVSDFTKKEFLRLVGQPRGQTSIIFEGVDEAWLSTKPDKAAGKPYIIFVGNIKPHKNLLRLMQAFDKLTEIIPHDLVLVGKRDGFLTGDENVAKMANLLGPRVNMTGQIPDKALRQLVSGADLLVLPSIYEGFGLPIVEAMACGCPVLASDIASLPEVGGDAVAYCNPFDVDDISNKISSLIENYPKRQRMRESGIRRAKTFKWETAATQTMTSLLSSIEL